MPTATTETEATATISAEHVEKVRKDITKAEESLKQNRVMVKLLAEKIGVDPGKIKAVPTGDRANPWKLEGLEDFEQSAEDAEWDKKELELTRKLKSAEESDNTARTKEITARDRWVASNVVTTELREAFSNANAIDTTQDKSFADLIELTRDRVTVSQSVDPATGKMTVKTTAADAAGDPCTVSEMVTEWLASRPALMRKGAPAPPQRIKFTGFQQEAPIMPNLDRFFGKAAAKPVEESIDQRMDRVFGKLAPRTVQNFNTHKTKY